MTTSATFEAPSAVHRPVQYLGSKLRVLADIVTAVNAGGAVQTVWEPFTGSSVVAQALASAGHRVVAADALLSSTTFAAAMLGVSAGDSDSATEAARRVLIRSQAYPVPEGWWPWLSREQDALDARDGAAILTLDAALPQTWRPGWDAQPSLHDAVEPSALLSDVFAGTYFGLRQALRLERLRAAIDDLEATGDLSRWERAAVLTALSGAASQAVFSAGKHFAQPHKVSVSKSLEFHAKRAVADRSVDVDTAFAAAARHVERAARPAAEGHHSYHGLVESITADDLRRWGTTTVYADPPYTAQQYSRFYHVLETLVSGQRPPLQQVRGQVTSGLYPEGRYLSPFCSRRQAPGAFARLARLCADADARLVLSYSGSPAPAVTGNARSVTIRQLVECFASAFGGADRVTVIELGLGYKQFNSSAAEVRGRAESEYLIIGEPIAR